MGGSRPQDSGALTGSQAPLSHQSMFNQPGTHVQGLRDSRTQATLASWQERAGREVAGSGGGAARWLLAPSGPGLGGIHIT